tara:strand:+ start:6931 stop:7224 length:294 start_codon:yes stop_codon:yes gene_type:complete
MPAVTRVGDKHVGHSSPTPNPFHQGSYSSGSPNVNANGKAVIRVDDPVDCGDKASAGSGTVKVNGKPIHRVGDATAGHGSWVANASDEGSPNVNAGG